MAEPEVRITVVPGRLVLLGGASGRALHLQAAWTAGSTAELQPAEVTQAIDFLCRLADYYPENPAVVQERHRQQARIRDLQAQRKWVATMHQPVDVREGDTIQNPLTDDTMVVARIERHVGGQWVVHGTDGVVLTLSRPRPLLVLARPSP